MADSIFRRLHSGMPSKRKVTSVIAYDGDALRSGQMDIRELAPALMGFGDLVRDANRALNGDRADVTVLVTSKFRRGSFGIKISLIQTILQHAKGLFGSEMLHDAVTLAKLLGLTIYSEKPKEVVENVFELLKFLRGSEAKKTEPLPDGSVKVTNVKGDTRIVNNGTLILVQDNSVRNDVRRLLLPLSSPGIDRFETRDVKTKEPVETITRGDLPVVPALPPAMTMTMHEMPALETRSTGLFQIVSLVFREGNKWKLNAGQGDFWAEIEDPVFLNRVHRHEILFGEGDALKAEYVSTAVRAGKKIESETKIVRVIEVIPPDDGSIQQDLALNPADDNE